MNKKYLIIVGIILVIGLLSLTIILPQKEDNYEEDLLGIEYIKDGNEQSLKYDTENPVVAMYIKKYGSIVIELYPDIAPNTVANFISLVKSGFYDGNSFHRLVPGFVLQGGDPDGTGAGGPGYTIAGEFTNNNFTNELSHTKWVVSMARSSEPDSAGSQFFICIDDATSLDGDYASFGKVIVGFDNIKRIVKNEAIADQDSGKLKNNLVIEKSVIDLKGKEYEEVKKITE